MLRFLVLLSVVGFILPACSLFMPAEEEELWVHEILEDGPPLRDVLANCEWALIQAQFPPGDRDDGAARVTSGWDEMIQPFSSNGRRFQGIFEVEPLGEQGLYRVSVRVRQQTNKEVHKPLDPGAAQWESIGDNQERARTLLYHLLTRIKDPGPSEDFYRRKPWRDDDAAGSAGAGNGSADAGGESAGAGGGQGNG